jgi:hypothetical protein
VKVDQILPNSSSDPNVHLLAGCNLVFNYHQPSLNRKVALFWLSGSLDLNPNELIVPLLECEIRATE